MKPIPVLFAPKPQISGDAQNICLKIINENNIELSLSLNKNGKGKYLARSSLCLFDNNNQKLLTDEIIDVSPEEFLKHLSEHLGYNISKKDSK